MDEPLTSSVFAPHVGETFRLTPQAGEPFEAVLTSCDETRYGTAEEWEKAIQRVPFSLVFEANAPDHHPQQIFQVSHAEITDVALFLVPLGPGEAGMRYHAVIS